MHFGLATSLELSLEVRRLLEGDVYFNVDTQRCGAY